MAVRGAARGSSAAGSQPAEARGQSAGPGAGVGMPAAAAAASQSAGGVREGVREGSLEAPTRHPIDWRNPDFFDQDALDAELERVFDICHGCRRCVSLCNAFPTLFDLVDESETMEVDGVSRSDYGKVVEQCYLCDLCYMTKCPYVPPHEWNVDFPHLMLRAKAVSYRRGRVKLRDRLITKTDVVGRFASLPVIVNAVNAANRSKPVRVAMDAGAGIHREANLPPYDSNSLRRRLRNLPSADTAERNGSPSGPATSGPGNPSGGGRVPAGATMAAARPVAGERTRGRVVLFGTCYGNWNEPRIGEDLAAVFAHNRIEVRLAPSERCCGMPRLELGDLESVEKSKDANVPVLAKLVDEGFDIVAPVPSCVLMFKQELPLMFPEDEQVARVRAAFYDPFEYLAQRHREGILRTRLPALPRDGCVPRRLPPAGAEHRLQDPRRAHSRAGHAGERDRALLRTRRDLRGQAGELCALDEDRAAGGAPGPRRGSRPLRERLPDGRKPHRPRPRRRSFGRPSADPAAQRIRNLTRPTHRKTIRSDEQADP